MRLFIEPTEPLLFRTGRPFDVGENNFAETLFPPTPETIQGAVRAAIATNWNRGQSLAENFADTDLVNLIGIYNDYGRFRITSFSLGRYERRKLHSNGQTMGEIERLFPAPSHILQDENGSEQIRLEPRSQNHVLTNLSKDLWLLYADTQNADSKLELLKGWLTEQDLHIALQTQDQIDPKHIVKDGDIYVKESRLGIGMNNKAKTTEEGMLYQVQMIRMNHDPNSKYSYGFVVDIGLNPPSDQGIQKTLHLPNSGWITLGGERRAAYFEVIHSTTNDTGEFAPERQTKGNLLYLATPASLDRGWQPEVWPTEHQPITASITRYQSIGGWKLNPGRYNDGENKVMHRCVPAGSVYFFNEEITLRQPLTDHGQEIGYGIAYIGQWNKGEANK